MTLLNCKITTLSFIYLGIPIGANPRLEDTWKSIMDKVGRRLNSLKHKSLSFIGIFLINLLMSSITLFFFYVFL